MFYFSVDTEDITENSIPIVQPTPTPSPGPSSLACERETLKYSTIHGIMEGYRDHMKNLISQLEHLANYTEICYRDKEDNKPFGPDILFQIKWCREYAFKVDQEGQDSIGDCTREIYEEYSDCIEVLFRAFRVAYRINNPVEYEDMTEKGMSIMQYMFGHDGPEDPLDWFRDDKFYRILELLYYTTLNVRDEMEFGISY